MRQRARALGVYTAERLSPHEGASNMTELFKPDQLLENGERFYYRGGNWTDRAGMRVSIVRSQQMTMKFYAEHGREPLLEPVPKPQPRAGSKAALAKASALRSAIAKAVAAKASNDDE